jgi:hypothetical protein
MKSNDDNRKLDPLLEQHLRREPEAFDFDTWTENHPDEAHLLRRGYETKTLTIWRFIMESRVTRYSAAAVIVLALTLVLFGPFGAPGNGGVVLADVQQKVNGIETMIVRGTKTFTLPDQDGAVFEFDGIKGHFDLIKYFSAQHGLVEEGYVDGELIYRFTFNRPQRQTLLLLPRYKKYGQFPSTAAQMRLLENGTPKGIVNLLMEGESKKLGRDTIDGVATEVFQFEEPDTFKDLLPEVIADFQSIKGKVWIAIDEQLPIRVEGDMTIGKSFMTMFRELNLHEINTLGDYNVELDEAIFDLTSPDDYTELTLTDILHFVPTEAKAGAAGLGLVPAGLVLWQRRRGRRAMANQA